MLLDIRDLTVNFNTYAGTVHAVRSTSLSIQEGEAVALVGESGCGKSVTAQCIMQIIPSPPGHIKEGAIFFNGENLLEKKAHDIEDIRGKNIGMIFQDPMTSLNPTMKIGTQIIEVLRRHTSLSYNEAYDKTIEILKMVKIPQPEERFHCYPYEFSGGMRQRAMIAIALVCRPQLLIADEPTTALDVTIQAQILDLLKELKDKLSMSILLITHDLSIVGGLCEKIIVMYAGKVMEQGLWSDIFHTPRHPYTQALLKTVPRFDAEEQETIEPIYGSPPDLMHPPKGCPFFARCSQAMKICKDHQPPLYDIEETSHVACWMYHKRTKEPQP
jgi:oligopeptide transport system ATP-binding protein